MPAQIVVWREENYEGRPDTLQEMERRVIEAALHSFNGSTGKTAKALNISVRKIQGRLKDWGKTSDDYRTLDPKEKARLKREKEDKLKAASRQQYMSDIREASKNRERNNAS